MLTLNIFLCVGLYVYVPNPDARSVGGGDGRDDVEDKRGARPSSRHLFHPLPLVRDADRAQLVRRRHLGQLGVRRGHQKAQAAQVQGAERGNQRNAALQAENFRAIPRLAANDHLAQITIRLHTA